ncbi:MAG: cysteine peptidase family C39 domain-containing protein [Planctomycetaceae bacterium]
MNHQGTRVLAASSPHCWWAAMTVTGLTLLLATSTLAQVVSDPWRLNEEEVKLAQRICGPHCVRWVLQRYGRDADLLELVEEMQWPDFESGTSFARLESSLEKRGLCVEALASRFVGEWNVPIIIEEQRPGRTISHFAVIDPELGYWDPALLDYVERSPDHFAGRLLVVYPCTHPRPVPVRSVFDYVLAGSALALSATAVFLVVSRPT